MKNFEIFNNKKRSQLSLKYYLITLAVLVTLFSFGTAFDLEICKGIWYGLGKQEILGRVVSGTLCNIAFFFVYALIFSFAIASFKYKENKLWVTICATGLAAGAIGYYSYFQFDDFWYEVHKVNTMLFPNSGDGVCWAFMALFWAINWSGSFMLAWYYISKRVDYRLMIRAGLFLIIGVFLIMAGKEFWKAVWSRPRPSAVLSDEIEFTFRPIWDPHPFECLDKSLPSEYVDQLRSFPSGHTSAASLMVLSVSILTSLDLIKTNKNKNILLFLSYGLVVLVAFNRMIARCHFLTDVTGAAILALSVSFFMPWCFKKSTGKLLW